MSMTPPSSIVIRTIMLLLLLGSRTRPTAAGTNHTHTAGARPHCRSAGSARRHGPRVPYRHFTILSPVWKEEVCFLSFQSHSPLRHKQCGGRLPPAPAEGPYLS